VPVVDEQQRLLGIVSTMDVLAVWHRSAMTEQA
jgi:CBS-domain-containing membrane protein